LQEEKMPDLPFLVIFVGSATQSDRFQLMAEKATRAEAVTEARRRHAEGCDVVVAEVALRLVREYDPR
jgi:hypothetical protein